MTEKTTYDKNVTKKLAKRFFNEQSTDEMRQSPVFAQRRQEFIEEALNDQQTTQGLYEYYKAPNPGQQ